MSKRFVERYMATSPGKQLSIPVALPISTSSTRSIPGGELFDLVYKGMKSRPGKPSRATAATPIRF